MAALFNIEEAYRAGREDMATAYRRAQYAVTNQIVPEHKLEEVIESQSIILQQRRIERGELTPLREIVGIA